MPSVICKNLAKSRSSVTLLVLMVTTPPVVILVKLYITSLLVLLVISSISSILYLPWNLTDPTPSSTSLGSDSKPFCIVSTVLNASVLIFAAGPDVTEFVTALENVCNDVSELMPTLAVTVVLVTVT